MWTPYPSCKRLCRKIFNAHGIVEKEEKAFFFEKKKQKTLCLRVSWRKIRDSDQKFFGSFFQKRPSSISRRAPRDVADPPKISSQEIFFLVIDPTRTAV